MADLSSQSEVRRLADEILQNLARIDVLVNNVGGYWNSRHITADIGEHGTQSPCRFICGLRVIEHRQNVFGLVVRLDMHHRLQQAIENLLANAVAHSPPGTAIRVDVCSLVRDLQRWVEVRVTDRGPGVPAALIPHLFECFSTGPIRPGLAWACFWLEA